MSCFKRLRLWWSIKKMERALEKHYKKCVEQINKLADEVLGEM